MKYMKKVLFLIGGGGILMTLGGGLLTGLRLQRMVERQAGSSLHVEATTEREFAGAIRA